MAKTFKDLLIEELENFPLEKFTLANGSLNRRKVWALPKDFRQDALNYWFLSKAIEVHGLFFDYEQTEYVFMNQRVKIGCPDCGKIFLQLPRNHLAGHCCPKCSGFLQTRETPLGTFRVPHQLHSYYIQGSTVVFYNNLEKLYYEASDSIA